MKKLFIFLFCTLVFFSGSNGYSSELGCDLAWEWYDEGLRLYDNSDREAEYYRQAIVLCPGFVAARNRLGELYKNTGRFDLSLREFEQARIEALSSNTFSSRSSSRELFLESSVGLGEIYQIQGQYKQAAEEFAKALQIDPDSPAAQNHLQYVYKRMHRYDDTLIPHNRMLVNGVFTRLPGMTLPRGSGSLDFQFRAWSQTSSFNRTQFDDERISLGIAPAERQSDIRLGIVSLRYGLTNNLTVGIIPKYFSRTTEMQLDTDPELESPTINGLGDIELLLKYHIWGRRNRHVSFYTMINMPIGKEIEVKGDRPLVRTLVDENGNVISTREIFFKRYVPLGSDSYDLTPGLALTVGLHPFVFHANMQYRFTNDELIGDQFLLNCGAVYRVNRSVNATLEMNYRWEGDAVRRQHVIAFLFRPDFVGRERTPAGPLELDTTYTEYGGHSFFISPGLQFSIAEKIRFEVGVQLPVIEPSDGWISGVVYQVGITYAF